MRAAVGILTVPDEDKGVIDLDQLDENCMPQRKMRITASLMLGKLTK
jgi:hypothetical protein